MSNQHFKCGRCGRPIPHVRPQALPGTRVCVRCSEERKVTEADVKLDGADRSEMTQPNHNDEDK